MSGSGSRPGLVRLSRLAVTLLSLAPADARAEDAVRACPDRAALYSGDRGVRLWATRLGSMMPENPLRPLSGNRLAVLQVIVNGRLATAYGPDTDHMQQGAAPKQLEGLVGTAIAWSPPEEPYPETFRIVTADGSPVLGPLRFQDCGDAPALAASKEPARTRTTRGTLEPAPSRTLPQGALR